MKSHRAQFVLGYSLVWAGLIWSALQIVKLPLGPVHFLCGPWGCIGSTSALISVHTLWLCVLVPLAVLLIWAVPALRRPVIWWALLAGSLMLIAGLVGRDAWHYLAVEQGQWQDLPRLALYCLAVNTDLPAWQISATALIVLSTLRIGFPVARAASSIPRQREQSA